MSLALARHRRAFAGGSQTNQGISSRFVQLANEKTGAAEAAPVGHSKEGLVELSKR